MRHAWPGGIAVATILGFALAGMAPARASQDTLPAHMVATVRRHDAQLRGCYARALRAEPSLRGKLVVHFHVAATGRTRDVRFEATPTSLSHPHIEQCVARVFRSMRFRRSAAPAWFRTPLVFVGG